MTKKATTVAPKMELQSWLFFVSIRLELDCSLNLQIVQNNIQALYHNL